MVPVGYMAKRVELIPDWIKSTAAKEVHSVSNCVSHDFTNYIDYWKHNGYWFFDEIETIREIATENSIDMTNASYFYYEAYELQYLDDERLWVPLPTDLPFPVNVKAPSIKELEGYDVVTYSVGTSPECSPLSCNNVAEKVIVNRHCLLATLEDAKTFIETGAFDNTEPGPFRIFAVYAVNRNDQVTI
jgi:hypothetical protein